MHIHVKYHDVTYSCTDEAGHSLSIPFSHFVDISKYDHILFAAPSLIDANYVLFNGKNSHIFLSAPVTAVKRKEKIYSQQYFHVTYFKVQQPQYCPSIQLDVFDSHMTPLLGFDFNQLAISLHFRIIIQI